MSHRFLRDEENLTQNEMHYDRMYWDIEEDQDEIFCNLCGWGYDSWMEIKKHIFCEHYDIVRDSVRDQLDGFVYRLDNH